VESIGEGGVFTENDLVRRGFVPAATGFILFPPKDVVKMPSTKGR